MIGSRSRRGRRALIASMLLSPGLALLALGRAPAAPAPIELDDAFIIIEVNATDGDAGVQFFLDGDAWRSVTVTDPGGKVVVDLDVDGALALQGLTEVFSESSEPSFAQQPLEAFLRRFPPGVYVFSGVTTHGDRLAGRAELTHALPDAPVIATPVRGRPVDVNEMVIAWSPVPDPPGSAITGYQLIVELAAEPLREFTVDLPASVNSVQIPAALIEPDARYKFELAALETSGNRTITEATFVTRPARRAPGAGFHAAPDQAGRRDLSTIVGIWSDNG